MSNKRIEQTAKAFAVILLGIVQLLIRNTFDRRGVRAAGDLLAAVAAKGLARAEGWAMTDSGWASNPIAVHVGANDSTVACLRQEAEAAGARVILLDLSGVCDEVALEGRLADVFAYPYEAKGLDAAIDLISDLEWMDDGGIGYLIVVGGLDRAACDAVEAFAGILPGIINRRRAQQVPFVVVLRGRAHIAEVIAALEARNAWYAEAAKCPWSQPGTGPIPFLVHAVSVEQAYRADGQKVD